MELLNFVFSSFWTFCGSVILLWIVVMPFLAIAVAIGARK
jgi:hypothetical protein